MAHQCVPCGFRGRTSSCLLTHRTRQKHFLITGDILIRKKYYCTPCQYTAEYRSHWDRHLGSKRHKVLTNPPVLHACDLCSYKSYSRVYYTRHIKRHRTKQTHVKKMTYKSKLADHLKGIKPKQPTFITDSDVVRGKINGILEQFKRDGTDPNKLFNYRYYACKDRMTIVDLNDFLCELT